MRRAGPDGKGKPRIISGLTPLAQPMSAPHTDSTPALVVDNLRKTYRNGVEALKGVSLTVQPGDFFALLGPNGAGKSTLIGILSSLVNSTGGDAQVFGVSVNRQRSEAMKLIGLVPQEINFNQFEKPFDICVNEAGFYGIPRKLAAERAEKYLKELRLWDKAFHQAREMSGGMKRRLEIARGLLHHPHILFLDEPTLGLDTQTRNLLWDYVRQLSQKEGMTIFFSTHYLEEAEQIAEHIAIIDHGKIVAHGTVAELKKQTKTASLEAAYLELTGKELRDENASGKDAARLRVRAVAGRR